MYSTHGRSDQEHVLIALHADGFVEAYTEKHMNVLITRVPHCVGAESLSEDVFELSLPREFRRLYLPGYLRASALNRPLLPSTMQHGLFVKDLLKNLQELEAFHQGQAKEEAAWMNL